ncbi:hypothetical protein M0R45_022323 [Rubus argutus]|uniref:Uncharacterized protein n=1 Tax=Rubus argutus TaxID=59490 RepID=A0AAW1XE50_RUBAR
MAQPGGNENYSNPPQFALGVVLMFTRGSSVRFSSAVDDVEWPRNCLDSAINEERSLSTGGGGGSIGGRGRREREQKQPQPHPISSQLGPSRWNRRWLSPEETKTAPTRLW